MVKENWKKSSVKEISTIYGRIGFRGYTKEDIVEEYCGAISLSPSNIVNNKIDTSSSTFISWYKYKESPEIMLKSGDVVLVKTGSTYGKSAYVDELDWETTLNPQIIVFKNIKINSRLFAYLIQTQEFQKQIEATIVGGAIPTLSQNQIYGFEITFPEDVLEQQKIAEALSDTDNLVSSLEKLIEKKKAIKQGAMQKLLTGKTRLPGYNCKKNVVKLSDITIIKDGTHGTYNRIDNGVYLLSAKNIFNNHMEITDNESMISIDDYLSIVSNGFPKENDILLSCVGTIGRCCIYTGTPRAAFQRSVAFVRSKNVDVRYLLCLLQSEAIQKQLKESSNASAQGGVYLGALENLNIEIVTDINEQKAIADILFDMDAEITALEQKLVKCQKLKQGMMQQLLTGKIRLI